MAPAPVRRPPLSDRVVTGNEYETLAVFDVSTPTAQPFQIRCQMLLDTDPGTTGRFRLRSSVDGVLAGFTEVQDTSGYLIRWINWQVLTNGDHRIYLEGRRLTGAAGGPRVIDARCTIMSAPPGGGTAASPILLAVDQTDTSPPFETSATATQIDTNADLTANATEVGEAMDVVNVHMFGFGMDENISTGDGVPYDFTTLDARVAAAAAGGSEVMITFLGTPVWMRSGDPTLMPLNKYDPAPPTDPFDFTPPHIDHLADYADLCAAIVARYDGTGGQPLINRYQVWNEMKGYFGSTLIFDQAPGTPGRWWFEGYTDMYNAVWTACKAVRSNVDIGGPYVVTKTQGNTLGYTATPEIPQQSTGQEWDQRDLDVLKYWVANSNWDVTTDTIVIDIKNHNTSNDGVCPDAARTPWNSMGAKLDEIIPWIRALPGAANAKIGFGEWYCRTRYWNKTLQAFDQMFLSSNVTASDAELTSIVAWSMIDTILADVSYALQWQLGMDRDYLTNGGSWRAWPFNIWDESLTPTILDPVYEWVKTNIVGRTDVRSVTFSEGTDLHGIYGNGQVMIVSKSDIAQDVTLPTTPSQTTISVPAYGVVTASLAAGAGGSGTPAPTIPTFNYGSATTVASGQSLAAALAAGASGPTPGSGDHFFVENGAIVDNALAKAGQYIMLAGDFVGDGGPGSVGYFIRPEDQTADNVIIGSDPLSTSRAMIKGYGNDTTSQDYGAIMGRTDDILGSEFIYRDVDGWFIYGIEFESNSSNAILLGSNFTVYDCVIHGHKVTGIGGGRIVGGLIHSTVLYYNGTDGAGGVFGNAANIKLTSFNADTSRTDITPIDRPKAQLIISNCVAEGPDRGSGIGAAARGIWFDIDCQDILVEFCEIDDHNNFGLTAEVCNDIHFHDNTIRRSNGFGVAFNDDFIAGALMIAESTNCTARRNTLIDCDIAIVNRLSSRPDMIAGGGFPIADPGDGRLWILPETTIPAVPGQSNYWTGNNIYEGNILVNCERVMINEGITNAGQDNVQGGTPIATIDFLGNDYSGSPSIEFYDRSLTALSLGQWQALGNDT